MTATSHTTMLHPASYYTATIGYGFAYFAFIRSRPANCVFASAGSTFFLLFESYQSDEPVSKTTGKQA